jgi:predicted RNase H-like HicB family nuclease
MRVAMALSYSVASLAAVISSRNVATIASEEARMIFHVTLNRAEDGWIVAECPALPGCVSQGKDEEEALKNIKEAITAWMWAEDQKAMKSLPSEQTPLAVAV